MGFNAINFIISTVGATSLNNTQRQGVNQNAFNNVKENFVNSNSNSSLINNFLQNAQNKTETGLSVLNQRIISTVEVEQQANYIKDLLNLPRDFQDLIQQIQQGNTNLSSMKELSKLLVNGKIDLTALAQILSDNSKEAVQKLMMTIMSVSKMGAQDVSQLKELMGLFSTAGANLSSEQTVKNLLLLYLPWLPLSQRNDLNLDFEIGINDKNSGSNQGGSSETIRIMIQTANYGNILATLEISNEGNVDVIISATEDFPEREVIEKLNKEGKKSGFKTSLTVQTQKTEHKAEDKTQDVQITTSDYVSPKLILAAHSLIKIIIDIDSRNFIINEEEEN